MATKVEIKLTRREVQDMIAGLDEWAIGNMRDHFDLLSEGDRDLLWRLGKLVPKIKKQVD